MSGIPLVARTQVDVVSLVVNAAYGGVGTLVDNSTDSSAVRLLNTSNEVIEYQVGSGAWLSVAVREAIRLDLNLSTTQLRLRMAQFARAGSAQLKITSLTGDYAVGDDVVVLGGETSAEALVGSTNPPRENGPPTAGASQSVPVPGVGTLTFTHGVLTRFTPA